MKILCVAILSLACIGAPGCDDGTPSGPSATDLTGTWSGTSTYPNAPFQLSLTQSGGVLRGDYTDRLDRSIAVTGTFSNPTIAVVIDFGDAKLNIDGTVADARTVRGTMHTSALGPTQYPFTMTR